MKRALTYFVIAIFMLLVVQPNLGLQNNNTNRVPQNTTNNATTNDNAYIPQSQNKSTICVDPGNGGQDTGYIVNDQLNEKDINLTLGLKLGESLERAGYKVVYTRTDNNIDAYTQESDSAKARINSAIDQKAEYFISIQMNDDENALRKGYSLFTQPNDKMIDLANTISNKLDAISYSKFDGLDSDHYSNFPILQEQDLPSLLLELGYLSNHEDLTKLTDEKFQDKIVYAITEAFVEVIG